MKGVKQAFFAVLAMVPAVVASSIQWVSSNALDSIWSCMAMSRDGYALAGKADGGFMSVTYDYGAYWQNQLFFFPDFIYMNGVGISLSGKYVVIVGADQDHNPKVWYSNTSTYSWFEYDQPGTLFQSVTMSGKGKLIVTFDSDGQIWRSNHYGANLVLTDAPALDWLALRLSYSGQNIVASSATHGIYYSRDYGVTWFLSDAPADAQTVWTTALAMSTPGDLVVAGTAGGKLYISRDAGVTWTANSHGIAAPWTTAACDAKGQYIMAAGNGTAMHMSADYGYTWEVSGDDSTTDGEMLYDWQNLVMDDAATQMIVFRINGSEADSNGTSIFMTTDPFGLLKTDDDDGYYNGGGGGSHTNVAVIVVPCALGGAALLLLVACCWAASRAEARKKTTDVRRSFQQEPEDSIARAPPAVGRYSAENTRRYVELTSTHTQPSGQSEEALVVLGADKEDSAAGLAESVP